MESHRQEMKVLQDRLQLEIEEHVKKMKKVHEDYVNAPQRQFATDHQVCHMTSNQIFFPPFLY